MQKRWTGKSVDLDLLSDHIENFFKVRSLATRRTESADERVILSQSERAIKAGKPISVKISGDPDDFRIEMKASELTDRSVRLGTLTKPIGGGYFLLKSLKLRDRLEKLEKEFWIYVEEKVVQLTGTAKKASRLSS